MYKTGSFVKALEFIDMRIPEGLIGKVLGHDDIGVMVEWEREISGHDGVLGGFYIQGKKRHCWFVYYRFVAPHNSKFQKHLERLKLEL